jgi:hypothetical protein
MLTYQQSILSIPVRPHIVGLFVPFEQKAKVTTYIDTKKFP